MTKLAKLYMFVHPMPRRQDARLEYLAKWEHLIVAEGPEPTNCVCLIRDEAKYTDLLVDLARRYFGERCIVDPDDHSAETKALLADDLDRTLAERGRYDEWLPYEIWTSCNARRWTEGLRRRLSDMGLTYDPNSLHLVTCGQQWGGCVTKYSMFIARYLGLNLPADLRPDLCPDAGWPLKGRFVERMLLDENVYLFLFELADGRPMAQFVDGLRAVWELPHIAEIPIPAGMLNKSAHERPVEVITLAPSGAVLPRPIARQIEDGIVAEVGDGCHPASTTLIGNVGYDQFRAAMLGARILRRDDRSPVTYMVGYMDPITTSRGEDVCW